MPDITSFPTIDQMVGEISIAWFGAVPNDPGKASANRKAINAAIAAAQTAAPPPPPMQASSMALLIPAGTFYIDGPLELGSANNGMPITIRGVSCVTSGITGLAGPDWGSTGSATSAIFSFGEIESVGYRFCDFFLDGNGVASYGVSSNRVAHLTMSRVRVVQTLVAAVNIGYGFCNTIENCRIEDNDGHGIVLNAAGNNNAVALVNNKIGGNAGIGVIAISGASVTIAENTFEANDQGAICAVGILGLSIENNYFERNCQKGFTFTEPGVTIHADIIFTGSSPESTSTLGPAWTWKMSNPYPSGQRAASNATIAGNFLSTLLASQGYVFIWLGAAYPVLIVGNIQIIDGWTPVPLAGCQPNWKYSYLSRTSMTGNSGFSGDLKVVNPVYTDCYMDFASFSSDRVNPVNYMSQDVFKYGVLFAGTDAGSSILRSARKRGSNEVLDIVTTSESHCFGTSLMIDPNNNPELAGQTVYLAVEYYIDYPPGPSSIPDALYLYINGIINSTSITGTGWQFVSTYYVVPDTLPDPFTLTFGLQAVKGSGGTGKVSFTKPVLAIVGAPFSSFYRGPQNVRWTSSAPPTSGAWLVGDIVYNSAPASGAFAGWICTTAGPSFTWHGFGIIV